MLDEFGSLIPDEVVDFVEQLALKLGLLPEDDSLFVKIQGNEDELLALQQSKKENHEMILLLVSVVLGVVVGIVLAGLLIWATQCAVWALKGKPTQSRPTEVGSISQLWVYPVKSGRGISVPATVRWPLDARGLRWDRRWMLVDRTTGGFLSQRQVPRLALLGVQLLSAGAEDNEWLDVSDGGDVDAIRLSHPDATAPIIVPVRSSPTAEGRGGVALRQVDIWGTKVNDAVDQGDDVSEWLQNALLPGGGLEIQGTGDTLRSIGLVFMSDNEGAQRWVGKTKYKGKYKAKQQLQDARAAGEVTSANETKGQEPTDMVSFADGMPALLVTEESLEALNRRLEQSPLCRATQEQGKGEDKDKGSLHKHRLRGSLPVDWRRFRPNIAVKQTGAGNGAAARGVRRGAFAEDTWWRVRFLEGSKEGVRGEEGHCVDATGTKLCVRCNIPQIDPDTGTPGGFDAEPTRTMRSFRRSAKGVLMGINMALHTPGGKGEESPGRTYRGLQVGDRVQVLQGPSNCTGGQIEPALIPEHEAMRNAVEMEANEHEERPPSIRKKEE